MSSDDSDDEPLSVIAANKKQYPAKYATAGPRQGENRRKRPKPRVPKNSTSISIRVNQTETEVSVVERPCDVWLYMKDLNPIGPYSCLLCSEWFINKAKIMVHYILNHKKDYCGICRYFVAGREDWASHQQFHTPWSCSQCGEPFPTESEMRDHLSSAHNLVHCRLCHFRLSDDDHYKDHLLQKHSISNLLNIKDEFLWENQCDNPQNFVCTLCSKSDLLTVQFFSHYMGYHHFTLKCFSNILSGKDVPFSVDGADISSGFIDGELKKHMRLGYLDAEKKGQDNQDSDNIDCNISALIPEIKQEALSDGDDGNREEHDNVDTYKGIKDFDVTLMEVISLQKCYYDYIQYTLNEIASKVLPEDSNIDYGPAKNDEQIEIQCMLCEMSFESVHPYCTHMSIRHYVKVVPIFSCRLCTMTFDTQSELENHVGDEMKEFDDLWMCQFCDKEFDNRETTRKHLNEHLDVIDNENCFSPHLGFKCRYCPTLFWNETDRNSHQIKAHFSSHTEDFYKCESCSEIFSDQVWFSHHHLEKHQDEANKSAYLYKCCLCCIALSTMEDMRAHFASSHTGAKKIFCTLGSCTYKPLSNMKSFRSHLKSHHSSELPPSDSNICNICSREFPTARACSSHMTQVHGTGKFKCKLCKEVMNTIDERKLHYLIRHPGRHPFSCNECGKSFQYKSSLYMHKQEHSPVKKSFTCSYCSKVFLKKDSFREHVQIHEGPRHACSYCPKRFVQRSNMLRHERRHTGERPYHCQHCSRAFSDKGACTAHARTHTKDRSYPCLYCGQTFVQKSKLTYHIRKHTGENLETCTLCGKLFTSPCSLREHMKTHDTKRDAVQCPLCDRKYQDERCMVRHLRTVHTQTRYECPLCPKALTSVAGLRHHVVTHSDVYMYMCKLCPKSYAVRRTLIKHLRRRHNLKGTNSIMKDFYTLRNPKDYNLGLDDKVMNEIFGPQRKKATDVLLGDFITLKDIGDQNMDDQGQPTDDDDEDDGEKSDEDSEENRDSEDGNETVMDLEPTDFVSVKIEPMDADVPCGDN